MTTSQTLWGKLGTLCSTIHELHYLKRDTEGARKHLPKLKEMLESLPHEDQAIIRAEAIALYHELRDEPDLAIKHRLREVELMDELFNDIKLNDYDEMTKSALLAGRNQEVYDARIEIIKALQKKGD